MTVFLDAISTGHIGFATVHSNSAESTIDRLVTLFKRDVKNQLYSEDFILELLSNSIECIIYMKDYKVQEIIMCSYDFKIKKPQYINVYKGSEI